MNAYVHGGAAAPRKTKRVFLRTGTAAEGKALCYNWDSLNRDTEAILTTDAQIGADDWGDPRRTQVEPPLYSNNLHFAGVVDHASDGVVGPNWVTINEPGSVCKVYTGAAVSVGGGGVINQGTTRNFTVATNSLGAAGTANGEFNYAGLPGCGCAMLLAEGAASTPDDSYLKMALLQDGPASGGVQTLTLISVNATETIAIQHGVLNWSISNTSAELGGTISVQAGDFIGQEMIVMSPLATNSNAVTVDSLKFTSAALSLEYLAGVGMISVAGVLLSAPTEYFHGKWNGAAWECTIAAAAGWTG